MDDTVLAIAKAVYNLGKSNPDYVYQIPPDHVNCYYTRSVGSDTEGCIIGQAILTLRPDLRETLVELDNTEPMGVAGVLMHTMEINYFEVDTETQALVDTLTTVQIRQDGEKEWGIAIMPLEKFFENRPDLNFPSSG